MILICIFQGINDFPFFTYANLQQNARYTEVSVIGFFPKNSAVPIQKHITLN